MRLHTPIETYQLLNGRTVIVKRDDLAGTYPAPPLGKLRGIANQIVANQTQTIGVVDRSPNSRNSWAHAYVAEGLGIRCVAYGNSVGKYQEETLKLGATYVVVDEFEPDRLYQEAREKFLGKFPDCWMSEDDCHSKYLLDDTEREAKWTLEQITSNSLTLLIPTGSGGLAIGILRGVVASGREEMIREVILHSGGSRRAKEYLLGVLRKHTKGYRDRIRVEVASPVGCCLCPFPASPIYEDKAWRWLERERLEGDVLFWNAGG